MGICKPSFGEALVRIISRQLASQPLVGTQSPDFQQLPTKAIYAKRLGECELANARSLPYLVQVPSPPHLLAPLSCFERFAVARSSVSHASERDRDVERHAPPSASKV